jgi:hypothetical protein
MAIESHVKRIYTDSYNHLRTRIRRCPTRIGILDTHIARKVTAPLWRAVPRDFTGQYFRDYAYKKAVFPMRDSCESVPEIIPIDKGPNNCPLLRGALFLMRLYECF